MTIGTLIPLAGNTGASGYSGATGASGLTGATGVTGGSGQTGRTGLTGAAGVTGSSGQTGTTGSVGATGVLTGVATAVHGSWYWADAYVFERLFTTAFGILFHSMPMRSLIFEYRLICCSTMHAGDSGLTGYSGATGTTGDDGQTGATGLTGGSGQTGFTGQTGVKGTPCGLLLLCNTICVNCDAKEAFHSMDQAYLLRNSDMFSAEGCDRCCLAMRMIHIEWEAQ